MCIIHCQSIVDFKDPKDRMIQVLRWYLSAFHAGRKVIRPFYHYTVCLFTNDCHKSFQYIFYLYIKNKHMNSSRLTDMINYSLHFHQSSIAKKPYNPIIGETFCCHYVLDENKRSKVLHFSLLQAFIFNSREFILYLFFETLYSCNE